MESLQDLLGKHAAPQEPPEIAAIKRYVQDEFATTCAVSVQEKSLTITVRSASLANALRLRTVALREASGTDKRLVFRIG